VSEEANPYRGSRRPVVPDVASDVTPDMAPQAGTADRPDDHQPRHTPTRDASRHDATGHEPAEPQPPRLAVNQVTTYHWPFEEDLLGYARAGIDGVGLWRPKLEECGEEMAAELLAESQLAVSSLSWVGGFTGHNDYRFQEAVADAREMIATAGRLGAGCVVLVSGARAGHTFNHARRLLVAALDELGGFADQCGVRLAVQPMMRLFADDWTFLATIDETLGVLDACRHPEVGMVFDVYHLWREPKLLERIRRIAPRVALVQLGDWHREPHSRYDRGMLGDGRIPLAEIVHAFTDSGYAGHFEVSIWSEQIWQSDYDQVLPLCRQRFEALLGSHVG
jgi:sugar phosphate isomerase/epimerase